jgi:hypothetical protein
VKTQDVVALCPPRCRDFFLGRDFQNFGRNQKFRYPPRNCITRQIFLANLNLNSDPESNKQCMRLASCRIMWRGGLEANRYDSALGRMFEFPCRVNILFIFLFFLQKYIKVRAAWFEPATRGLFPASCYHYATKIVLSNWGRILFVCAQNILNSNFIKKISIKKSPRFMRFRGNQIFRCPPVKKMVSRKKTLPRCLQRGPHVLSHAMEHQSCQRTPWTGATRTKSHAKDRRLSRTPQASTEGLRDCIWACQTIMTRQDRG